MIPEERLGRLLEAAAERFPPPAGGPERVLATAAPASPAPQRRRPGPRRLGLGLAAAVVVVALGMAVVDSGLDRTTRNDSSGMAAPEAGFDEQDEALRGAAQTASGTRSAGAGGGSAGDDTGGAPPAAPAQVDLVKVIKTGSVVVEVGDGRLDEAVSRITALATGAGGYVSASNTETSRDGHQAGTLTIRVPAAQFEAVLEAVGQLGELQQTEVAGREVTAESTDIEARLRVLTTSRDSLLRVLSEARAVGDILAVQDRLNAVQTEIEQLEGRRRVLDDQVAFATLAVSVSEPGQSELLRTGEERSVWRQAIDGFTGTWGAVVAKSGTATALVLLAAALLALLVVAVRSGRRLYARLVA